MRFSAIRRMSALIERPGIISFAPGQPSPETFPVDEFAAIVEDVLAAEKASAFQYILTRGLAPLLEAVREYAGAKGLPCAADELLITEGSQQGLDLLSRVLLDAGDVVFVERPTYVGAMSAFRAAQARMVDVPLDGEGLDVRALRRRHAEVVAAGGRPKFLYVIPNFQNPKGVSHTLERRRALLEAAHDLDLLVVEDDPYGDLYFGNEPPAALRALDPTGVVYLSSFSKILAPGLRTAFVIGDAALLSKVEIAKQSADLCGSGLDQRIVLGCLRRGLIERQKERIRPYYRAKRDTMLAALAREVGEGARWTEPEGGLFVWLTLPEGRDAEALLPVAVEAGVAYVAGGPFHAGGGGENTMRLTFARESGPAIEDGVRRLARTLRA